MGIWGYGSDENDWTWDAIGFGIKARAMGISLSERERGPEGIVKDLKEDNDCDLSAYNVVVILLKLGCSLEMENLNAAIAKLQTFVGLVHLAHDHRKERAKFLTEEIAMIKKAIDNGGSVPGKPIGARGIFGSRDGAGDAGDFIVELL